MTRSEATKLIKKLLPKVWRESYFLWGNDAPFQIPAREVFDLLRKASEPPISEDEFNEIADKYSKTKTAQA